jgi:cell division protein FtsL
LFQNTTDNDNDNNNEKSFSDAYRSEILDNNSNKEEESSLKKLMFILLLVVLISTVSILTYKYFSGNTPQHNTNEVTVDRKVIEEEQKDLQEELTEDTLPQSTAMESMLIEDIESLEIMEAAQAKEMIPTPTANKNDIDNIAEQMKLEIAKELDKKNRPSEEESSKKTAPLTPQVQKGEDLYLKQLAELSKEIDKGKK